jgi:general secretion pathway protein I
MRARRRPRNPRSNAGFTLIEVIVALAIVVIGMAALLSTLTSSASTIVYLRDKTFANWVAENQIATTRLAAQARNQAPQTGNDSSGDVDFAGSKWHWQQKIIAAELPGMVRIEVSARPADVKADDAHGWYTTVTGLYCDALAQPRGDMPSWDGAVLTGSAAQPQTQGTDNSSSSSSSDGSDSSSSSSSSSSSTDFGFSHSSSSSSSSSSSFFQ